MAVVPAVSICGVQHSPKIIISLSLLDPCSLQSGILLHLVRQPRFFHNPPILDQLHIGYSLISSPVNLDSTL